LFRQVDRVVPHLRPMRLATAPKLWRAGSMMTRTASTLLAIHLGTRTGYIRAALGLMRSGLAARELPADNAMQYILARLQSENLFGKIDLTGLLARKRCDCHIHHSA